MDAIDYAFDELERKQRTEREFQELWLWYEHDHQDPDGEYCPVCGIGTLESVGVALVCTYCGLEAE